jgi:hypothetical protein
LLLALTLAAIGAAALFPGPAGAAANRGPQATSASGNVVHGDLPAAGPSRRGPRAIALRRGSKTGLAQASRKRKCRPGYVKVRIRGKRRCRRAEQSVPAATLQLATESAQRRVNANTGWPDTYDFLIYHSSCVVLSTGVGRCLVYFYIEGLASGYGYGGVERHVDREYFFATRIAPNLYSTRIQSIDFLQPYRYICYAQGLYGLPACTSSGPWY